MPDEKRPEIIPGYGQPPDDVRTDQPTLPDQGNRWAAGSEGKPRETPEEGTRGQNVEPGPDVPTPSRNAPDASAPDRTPVEGP